MLVCSSLWVLYKGTLFNQVALRKLQSTWYQSLAGYLVTVWWDPKPNKAGRPNKSDELEWTSGLFSNCSIGKVLGAFDLNLWQISKPGFSCPIIRGYVCLILAYTYILRTLNIFWHSGTYKKAAGASAKLFTNQAVGRRYNKYLWRITIFCKKQILSKLCLEQIRSSI